MRALTVSLALAVVVVAPGVALACGVMVSEEGSAELDGFEAMLGWAGGRETLLVAVSYTSPEDEFAWMMPFPAVPEVDEGSADPITIAREISTPPLPPSDDDGAGGAPPEGVGVEDREVVGDLEFVTLSAERASEIQRWMRRHDFAFHDTQESVVQSYLDQEWFIVAARVLPGAPEEGAMTPVRFEFESEEPVYPLRVAGSSHATAIPMELYVVTPFRPAAETYEEAAVEPIDGVFAEPEDRLEIRYSAPLTATDRARLRSPGLRPKNGAWLTRYEATWAPESLVADLVLRTAPQQEPISFVQEEDGGFSASMTIGLIAGMAVLILVGVAVVSRRRSSRWMFR